MQSFLHSVGERITPILRESNFEETGRLTPEEFVLAGDYLVFKCPTWQWATPASVEIVRDFLPINKQYLVTRGVPSVKRINEDVLREGQSESKDITNIDIVEGEEEGGVIDLRNEASTIDHNDSGIIPDMETFESTDNLVVTNNNNDNNGTTIENQVMQTRTYDLFITYDKYYQTPRMWITGYDEDGVPLRPDLFLSPQTDISTEHAQKTVTLETFPHSNSTYQIATVHPCKHANVMQSILERMKGGVRVDQYLIIFLKWMASVFPTINYDFTTSS